MGKKRDKKNLMWRTSRWLIMGCVLILFLSVVWTYQEKKQEAEKNTADMIQLMKTNCQKYDNYEIGLLTYELQNLINKINVLKNYMQEPVHKYWEKMGGSLSEFMKNQYLSGIILLDQELEIVENLDVEAAQNQELLTRLRSSGQLEQILGYPQKIYADCMQADQRNYQYAVAARTDAPGIVICYLDTSKYDNDKYEISLNNLLDFGLYEKEAVMVVADGNTILCSNRSDLQGVKLEDWSVAKVILQDMLPEADELITLRYDKETWWGKQAQYREYFLYIFYKAELFDHELLNNLFILFGLYLIFAFGILMFVQKREKEKLRQMEKEYYMLTSIASIYDASLLLHLESNTWEAILQTTAMETLLTGIKDTEEMLRVFCDQLMMQSARQKFLEFVDLHTISERMQGKDFLGYNFEAVSGRWYQVLLIPQARDEKECVTKVILLIRNVTDQTRRDLDYREQLRSSMEEADRANAAKTDFLRRMSHDIRTPINGIRGIAEIGKSGQHDPNEIRQYFDKILTASEYLLELVNDILDMSKIESGEMTEEQISFNLKELIQGSITIVSAQAEKLGIQIQCEWMEDAHWYLKGNALYVQRIIQNILSNAIKYNRPDGLVRISCREIKHDDQSALFVFVCEDTGIGMSREFQEHAYEMFAQEHKTARTTYSGTGLGLAIVKKTVEFLNGTIDFSSQEGKGTIFTIQLPLTIDQNKYDNPEKSEKEPRSIKGIRILLAEDNELNMEVASYMLQERGASIIEAKDGRQTVELFAASEPGTIDIILMDIMMPEVDGLEAARMIRAMERSDAGTVPIIAVSANAFAEDKEACRKSGMNDHLSKPLDFDRLIEMIGRYIR